MSRLSLSTIIICASIVWAGGAYLLGIELTWAHLSPFGAVLFTVSMLTLLFEKVLWAWPPFSMFAKIPDLRGKWEMELRSTFIDPATGNPKPPISGAATIRQTYSSLSIRTKTASQTSFLIAHSIKRHDDGVYEITGVFQSDPDIDLRGSQSEIHYGAFRYSLDGPPIGTMTGHYWTDRNTKGKIEFRRQAI